MPIHIPNPLSAVFFRTHQAAQDPPHPTRSNSSKTKPAHRKERKDPKPQRPSDMPFHPHLSNSHITALLHILSLPPSTPLLTTKIAWLGAPLSREIGSQAPHNLCNVHMWLEPVWIEQMDHLVRKELGHGGAEDPEGLGRLWQFPREALGMEVRELLETLRPFLELFGVHGYGWEKVSEASHSDAETAAGTVGEGVDGGCTACRLHRFVRDPVAVEALATCTKGRKYRGKPWPEVLVFLDPVDETNQEWRKKWIRDGKDVKLTRKRARIWRACKGEEEDNYSMKENEEEEMQVLFDFDVDDGANDDKKPGEGPSSHMSWFQACATADGESTGHDKQKPSREEIDRARAMAYQKLNANGRRGR